MVLEGALCMPGTYQADCRGTPWPRQHLSWPPSRFTRMVAPHAPLPLTNIQPGINGRASHVGSIRFEGACLAALAAGGHVGHYRVRRAAALARAAARAGGRRNLLLQAAAVEQQAASACRRGQHTWRGTVKARRRAAGRLGGGGEAVKDAAGGWWAEPPACQASRLPRLPPATQRHRCAAAHGCSPARRGRQLTAVWWRRHRVAGQQRHVAGCGGLLRAVDPGGSADAAHHAEHIRLPLLAQREADARQAQDRLH